MNMDVYVKKMFAFPYTIELFCKENKLIFYIN